MLAPTDAKAPKRKKWNYARQRRYRQRKREGFICVTFTTDGTTLAEYLHAAGVHVLYQDRPTLRLGLEELLRRFEEGRVRVTPLRESI